MALALTIRVNESIVIPGVGGIKIVKVQGKQVRIAIEIDKDLEVIRRDERGNLVKRKAEEKSDHYSG